MDFWIHDGFLDFIKNIDMSSTSSGYMGATHFQEFGPRFFDMSSSSGYMGAKYVQEFGPTYFGMSQMFDMSPSAVNFQFKSQFEFPNPAEHYGGCDCGW